MSDLSDVALHIRSVRHHKARIDHHFLSNGVIQRFVILESKELRDCLEKPRRVGIDPIDRRSATIVDLSAHDLWEMCVRTASTLLRELYTKVAEAKQAKRARDQSVRTEREQKLLGQRLVPVEGSRHEIGTLIYAGMRPRVPFCIELLDATGVVRRIDGIDLARALDVAQAHIGESICVTRVANHHVEMLEHHTGTHGSGKRKRKRSRVIYEITKELTDESTDHRGTSRPRSGTV